MGGITDQLHRDVERIDLDRHYREPICMWPVSKNLRGEFTVADQEQQESAGLTLKGHVKLTAQARSHLACDSVMSRLLEGDIEGEIVFAYIEDGDNRGYHVGRLRWDSGTSILIGQLSGVTNAGTHRVPPDCEPCERRGHMEGRLDAVVVEGDHKGCRLLAVHVIDFDAGIEVQSTAFRGALEGVLICDCATRPPPSSKDACRQ